MKSLSKVLEEHFFSILKNSTTKLPHCFFIRTSVVLLALVSLLLTVPKLAIPDISDTISVTAH